MRLYSWAIPRKAGNEKGRGAPLPFPDWFPQEWEPLKPFIRRLKLSFSIDQEAARAYLEEGAKAARDYQQAEKVVLRFLEGVWARASSNKDERTERTIERTNPSPTPSLPEGGAAETPPEKPPLERPETEDERQWQAFFVEVQNLGMECTDAEYPQRRKQFLKLPLEKQMAATHGLHERIGIGQYDPTRPQAIPSLRNYLFAELWTAAPRPPLAKKSLPDTSVLDLLDQGIPEEEALRIVEERNGKREKQPSTPDRAAAKGAGDAG